MTLELYVAFLVACAIVLVVPGPTIMLVVSQALAEGRRAVWSTVAGVSLGDLTAVTLSALGLGAVLAASATLFTLLKLAGAAYLVWLGVRTWRAGGQPLGAADTSVCRDRGTMFARAYAVTALNPKSIVFFVAFMPQFIVPAAPFLPQLLLLGGTFLVLATLNAAAYALLAGTAREAMRRPAVSRAAHRIGGGLLVGAGFWLATRRPD
jgi:threonine/homoserine/homoserine lactone efflux protein